MRTPDIANNVRYCEKHNTIYSRDSACPHCVKRRPRGKTRKTEKEFMVIIPKHIAEQIERLPEKDKKAIEKGLKQLQKDPFKNAKPFVPAKLKYGLLCGKCGSKDISWIIEVTDKEVHYSCNGCGLHAWMTEKEYKSALKKHPELIFEQTEDGMGKR